MKFAFSSNSPSATMIGGYYWPRSLVSSALLFISWDVFFFTHLTSRGVQAKPIRGLLHCLNNEDCLGVNRYCYRNLSMTDGICTCKSGYKPAEGNTIKCLNIQKHECDSELDCPSKTPCSQPLSYISNMELLIDDFNFSFGDIKKRCIFTVPATVLEPHTGGGLRPGGDFFESFYNFGAHNHRHLTAPSYHGEYIKFVEDAMLVLFLMCILVTLLVVHRATCRNFWRARRNGPLRYIIPYRDDQPPPYSQANVAGTVSVAGGNDTTDSGLVRAETTTTGAVAAAATDPAGKGNLRTETPPPTYDEALLISQTTTATTTAATTSGVAVNPLFIALPDSPTALASEARALFPVPESINEGSTSQLRPQVPEASEFTSSEDPPAYVSIHPLADSNE